MSKDPFKDTWAFCRYHFNMSTEEFNSLTMEEIGYLKDQVINEWSRQDARAAQICALLANINSRNKRYRVTDFMPDYSGKPREMSENEIRSVIKALHFVKTGENLDG